MNFSLQCIVDLEEQNNKLKLYEGILKNRSYIDLLNKIKKEFKKNKIVYLDKIEKLKNIKNENSKISQEITIENNLMDEKEKDLFGKYGNDLKMIEKLQQEIKNHKSHINQLEEKSINLLQDEKKLLDEAERVKDELRTIKNNFYSSKEDINKKIIEAKENIPKIKSLIFDLEKDIPKDLLNKYYEIRGKKGSGIVKVKNGVCPGCNIKVSGIINMSLAEKNKVIYCDNCGRMLYME